MAAKKVTKVTCSECKSKAEVLAESLKVSPLWKCPECGHLNNEDE